MLPTKYSLEEKKRKENSLTTLKPLVNKNDYLPFQEQND